MNEKESSPSGCHAALTVSLFLNGLLLGNLGPDFKESLAIIRTPPPPATSVSAKNVPHVDVAKILDSLRVKEENP